MFNFETCEIKLRKNTNSDNENQLSILDKKLLTTNQITQRGLKDHRINTINSI